MIDHAPLRALVVEDDSSWQQILREILSDCGLAVDVAPSLPQALAWASQGFHDLAVVDLSLEAANPHNQAGLQVLDALKSANPACQAILLTGFATVELAVSVLTEHGALTCLRKETFNRASFRDLVGQALQTVQHTPSGGAGSTVADVLEGQPPSAALVRSLPVLVVEDDPGWQAILSELLEEVGQDVHLCGGFGEALGRLRRQKYALAVIDLSLVEGRGVWYTSGGVDGQPPSGGRGVQHSPDFSGFRLLASARAAGIPTIVVSGVSTPDEIERAYEEYGIFAYLQKQVFVRKVFLATVAEALSAHPDLDELAALTGRERQVFDLLVQGLTNKEISDALVISTNTVKRHLTAIFGKLHIHTRSAAASKGIRS